MIQSRPTAAAILALACGLSATGTAGAGVVIKMPPPPPKVAATTTSYEVHVNGTRRQKADVGSLALSRFAHARITPRTRFYPEPKVFWFSNGPVGFPAGYGRWSSGWRGFGYGGFGCGFGYGFGFGIGGFHRPCFW